MKHEKMRQLSLLTALCLLLCVTASAASVSVDCTAEYVFQTSDFCADGKSMEGIFLVEVPKAYQAELCLGSRILRNGDVLPLQALQYMKLVPNASAETDCSLVFAPIQNGDLLAEQTMTMHILSGSNTAPDCRDSSLQTYKNIANTGTLQAQDAQNERMTYQLTKAPKRGTVELCEDGSFVYTPDHNKVGKDRFCFTATDAAGNVSEEAEVSIRILKPMDQAMYQDMTQQTGAFEAMWLKDQGIYAGRCVADQLLFEPNAKISRGDFLVMAMKMASIGPDDTGLDSSFDDAQQTAQWQQSYIVSAYQKGLISGTEEEEKLMFHPDNPLTNAEAAVILQKICKLPDGDMAVFKEATDIPVWSQCALTALSDAQIMLPASTVQELTRLDAAKVLYDCAMYLENQSQHKS